MNNIQGVAKMKINLKPIIVYDLFWAFSIALIRPLSGESILTFIERAANRAAPLALYLIIFIPKNKKP